LGQVTITLAVGLGEKVDQRRAGGILLLPAQHHGQILQRLRQTHLRGPGHSVIPLPRVQVLPHRHAQRRAEHYPVELRIVGYFGYSGVRDRKSTRLNSSHVKTSYAVFCLKKKMKLNEMLWLVVM